jgi:hypothetical protein
MNRWLKADEQTTEYLLINAWMSFAVHKRTGKHGEKMSRDYLAFLDITATKRNQENPN